MKVFTDDSSTFASYHLVTTFDKKKMLKMVKTQNWLDPIEISSPNMFRRLLETGKMVSERVNI